MCATSVASGSLNAMQSLLHHETVLRLGSFVVLLVVLAVAERVWPARGDARPARRQLANLGLMVLNTALLRIAFPLLAVVLAAQVHARAGGVFGWLQLSPWLEIPLAVLVFDATIYWQHRMMHVVGPLWRLHRVHHSDIAFDVTLGVRFHPLEMVVSMLVKLGFVVVLGPAAVAVMIAEILLAAASLFTHADFAFPARWDTRLRTVLVTPSMHRVHHSVLRAETDSNYGFLLSWWDRVFGSYRAHPLQPECEMPIGLTPWRQPAQLGFGALLLQPFRRLPAASAASSPTSEERTDA